MDKSYIENLRCINASISWDWDSNNTLAIAERSASDPDRDIILTLDLASVFTNTTRKWKYLAKFVSVVTDDFSLESSVKNIIPFYALGEFIDDNIIRFVFVDSRIPIPALLAQPTLNLTDLNNVTYSMNMGSARYYNFLIYAFDDRENNRLLLNSNQNLDEIEKLIILIERNMKIGIPIFHKYNSCATCDLKTERFDPSNNDFVTSNNNNTITYSATSPLHMVTHCQAPRPAFVPYFLIKGTSILSDRSKLNDRHANMINTINNNYTIQPYALLRLLNG